MFCVCQNCTLDQVTLCTPGRLNDVAPRPVPPAPGADRPRGPSLTFSPLSHPRLILIQPGMPFALYGLLACSTAPSMPPRLRNTVSPHKIISLCSRRQLDQIEHVSAVGGGGCFPALGAAKHSVTVCAIILQEKAEVVCEVAVRPSCMFL